MKKEPKWKYFERMTHFLMGRFGFDKPITVVRDNRLDCPCCVANWDDTENIQVKYNSRRLGQLPYPYVLSFILHEIGHLVNSLPYETPDEIIISEREAERFSNKWMKKEYPTMYKQMLKRMKEKKSLLKMFKSKGDRYPYYWAYKELQEYKQTTSKEDLKWLEKQEKKLNQW